MRDGHDAGTSMCAACFQLGKDVQIPTAENACGPLCGYKCAGRHSKRCCDQRASPRAQPSSAHASGGTAPARRMPELHRFSPWLNASQPQELLRGAALLRHAERVRFLHPVGSSEMTERDRPVELFYAGSINAEARQGARGFAARRGLIRAVEWSVPDAPTPGLRAPPTQLESDPSGRGELLRHHGGRAGWRVFNTHRSAALRSRPPVRGIG